MENWMVYHGYNELKEVERWWSVDDDESRMSVIMPGQVAPWAASLIARPRSFLLIHALFSLASRDLERWVMTFAPAFMDFVRHVDEEWDMLITCIKDGTIPDLEGIDHVRAHLQVHLHANPERATELHEIGSPSSCAGWAARVWPKLRVLVATCSGPFAFVLPKVRFVLGPTIAIRGRGYGAAEGHIAASYYTDDHDIFVLHTEDVIEFLDVGAEETPQNILQAWDLEASKRYQIVLTTRDGLWRYPLGDIIEIVGFDTNGGSPVFKYAGRKSLSIRFPHTLISDSDLVTAIQAISSEDIIQVHEFTVVVDDRKSPTTVGYIVEGPLGSKLHLARQKLFDALAAKNIGHLRARNLGRFGLPTIRIVKPGTFMEYRLRKAEKLGSGAGQIKVPVVLSQSAAIEWLEERVIQEL
ncbi:hypothetical protein PAXRUDRAFT_27885 [Paxillus rubicundulus Ve08.2h10]|uniref:Unplaced genomic scaffold scaffold_983, whole genome shotgun sequence n=1 Tax=Paxillus rubicundulus Ve08.2h10 TaxID=930991 RepID=A0A0D0DQ79_9AGAM|nr:hypothetical protein PAXRUDRAFT_27885 [Paxillus rubicundulus Ve08.2h10]